MRRPVSPCCGRRMAEEEPTCPVCKEPCVPEEDTWSLPDMPSCYDCGRSFSAVEVDRSPFDEDRCTDCVQRAVTRGTL